MKTILFGVAHPAFMLLLGKRLDMASQLIAHGFLYFVSCDTGLHLQADQREDTSDISPPGRRCPSGSGCERKSGGLQSRLDASGVRADDGPERPAAIAVPNRPYRDEPSTMAARRDDPVYAYKETLTIDDPQRLVLKQPLPLRKGQRVEVLVVAEGEDAELEMLRTEIAKRGVTEADVKDAIAWARGRAWSGLYSTPIP